jgi:hypothetical protein
MNPSREEGIVFCGLAHPKEAQNTSIIANAG